MMEENPFWDESPKINKRPGCAYLRPLPPSAVIALKMCRTGLGAVSLAVPILANGSALRPQMLNLRTGQMSVLKAHLTFL